MNHLGEIINERKRHLRLSIPELARRGELNEQFVRRLARGLKPPCTKEGWHTAESDDRYTRLGIALGFAGEELESFIASVVAAQISGKTETVSPHPPQEATEIDGESLEVRLAIELGKKVEDTKWQNAVRDVIHLLVQSLLGSKLASVQVALNVLEEEQYVASWSGNVGDAPPTSTLLLTSTDRLNAIPTEAGAGKSGAESAVQSGDQRVNYSQSLRTRHGKSERASTDSAARKTNAFKEIQGDFLKLTKSSDRLDSRKRLFVANALNRIGDLSISDAYRFSARFEELLEGS